MYHLIVFLPLVGFLIAGCFGRWIGARASELITTALLFVACVLSWIAFVSVGFGDGATRVQVAQWMSVGDLQVDWAFRVDTLTAMMLVVVNTVSSLVHLYSIGYMHEDPHRPRFFAFLSLFTFAMLMLVTADNFVQMFFGWEGVGLASYLLIGFWYHKESANAAAIKAFIVNRVGDFGFALGIFLVFVLFDSVAFDQIFPRVGELADQRFPFIGFDWHALTLACLLLFMGAMGKSAQFLLHTWLPDAMEGPTPVSALIHAATMVTAGVFMVARLSPLFEFAPAAQSVVIVIGAISVIHAMHHEQDMRKMGGLRRWIPTTAAMMAVGTLALTGFPFTAGYYSKDAIIEAAFASHRPGAAFGFLATVLAAFLTAFYSWRLFFMTFEQKPRWAGDAGYGTGDHEGVEHDERSRDLEPAHAADHEHGQDHGDHVPHESPLVMLVPLGLLV